MINIYRIHVWNRQRGSKKYCKISPLFGLIWRLLLGCLSCCAWQFCFLFKLSLQAPLQVLGWTPHLSSRSGHVVSERMLCPCWCSLSLSLRMALHGLEALTSNKAYSELTCCDCFLPHPSSKGAGLFPSLLALKPAINPGRPFGHRFADDPSHFGINQTSPSFL